MMHVFEGIKIKGIDEKGKEKDFSLSNLRKEIILYFYPKDNTSVCTKEAIDFRDKMKQLHDKATVIGVSPDSLNSHKEFQKSNSINYPLLSDPDNKLANLLGVSKVVEKGGSKYMSVDRSTFIIKDGLIKKAWRNVDVNGHVDDVINSL